MGAKNALMCGRMLVHPLVNIIVMPCKPESPCWEACVIVTSMGAKNTLLDDMCLSMSCMSDSISLSCDVDKGHVAFWSKLWKDAIHR